ncbi:hypothetical protein [Promicromonospora panici]|uniref:hypothetical protein n=1 Tax=Promicromonospora panici TaxID=2219658 RepID=UPI00101D3BBC|nr:hypothetical protein [Promicromonospora panici]
MLVTSRHVTEYRAFLCLTDADLTARRLLDCSAGASGFAAAVNAAGGSVTAVDPAYGDLAALRAAVAASSSGADALIDAHSDAFTWDWYGSPAARQALRDEARAAFLADLAASPGTYVPGALPDLPLPDDAFDLAITSHLLFTWADVVVDTPGGSVPLDEAWHHAALLELLRVAPEVRVFPLVRQGDGAAVPFLPRLLDDLRAEGHGAELRRVAYEFQRGADRMLVLRRHAGINDTPVT